MFRNNNPDKGTETHSITAVFFSIVIRLEIITPIRGRKLVYSHFYPLSAYGFRNNNPDKGTETVTM